MRLVSVANEADWIDSARAEFDAAASRAREDGRVLELLLSGGTSPEPVYRSLAARRLRELPIRLWLGDERAVGTSDPARNEILITRCFSRSDWEPAPETRPWPAGPASAAIAGYAATLAAALGDRPAFDLAFLGVGRDGHSASLFPGDGESLRALDEEVAGLAFATTAPVEPRSRMSLGARVLAGSRVIRFLTRGQAKREVLELILGDEGRQYPARIVAEQAEARGADVVFLHLESE